MFIFQVTFRIKKKTSILCRLDSNEQKADTNTRRKRPLDFDTNRDVPREKCPRADQTFPSMKLREQRNSRTSPSPRSRHGLDFDLIKHMDPNDELLSYVQKISYYYARAVEHR